MIRRLYRIDARQTDPYRNLALESALLDCTAEDECILYLWQNQKTVVIGRNQNAWKECDCRTLEADGGHLARRLSGGGAVFHDTGNLNFTFLVQRNNYDTEKQTRVILRAVQKLGIQAELSGRNDITAGGRKFSGNAYYLTDGPCYHHGTLLLSSDMEQVARYLTVSKAKLAGKGIDSVQSRVINLCIFRPDLTAGLMKDMLADSFAEVYGLDAGTFPDDRIDRTALAGYETQFSSWNWKYGRNIPFTGEISKRFSWGDLQIQLYVRAGSIQDCAFWSDSLDTGLITAAENAVRGMRFCVQDASARLDRIPVTGCMQQEELHDIALLLEEMM